MPLLRTEGFVLRVLPLGEADKIVTFLTREEGKIRAVARSARRSRKRFGSSLEPWSRVALSLFEKETAELARIDACDLLESAYRLHEDLETAYLLAYLAEVADLFSRERQAEPHYYRLLVSLLSALRAGLTRPVGLRYFEVWTLRLHGLLPDPTVCGRCGAAVGPAGASFAASSGQIACPRCRKAPTPDDIPLSKGTLNLLLAILRKSPFDLISLTVAGDRLVELGRMTTAALTGFAESSFRTARFVGTGEGAVR